MAKKSDYYLSRRQFVGGLVGVMGALMTVTVGLPIIGYLVSPALKKATAESWISLGPAADLEPGEPTLLTYSQVKQVGWKQAKTSYAVYAVAQPDGGVEVMSDVCTHLNCKVFWDADRQVFVCPCHDGIFDKEGAVISGPPPRPLDRLPSKVEDGQLMVEVEV